MAETLCSLKKKGGGESSIYIGDIYYANLTGSNTYANYPLKVVNVTPTKICLMGTINLGSSDYYTQCNKQWNVSLSVNGQNYSVTAKIPTVGQACSSAELNAFFDMWTSTFSRNAGGGYVYAMYLAVRTISGEAFASVSENTVSVSRASVPYVVLNGDF